MANRAPGAFSRFNVSQTDTVIGTVATDLFGGRVFDLQGHYHKNFTFWHKGGATLLSGVILVAPTSSGPWATLNTIGTGVAGSGDINNLLYDNGYGYNFWKAQAAVASGSVATMSSYIRF